MGWWKLDEKVETSVSTFYKKSGAQILASRMYGKTQTIVPKHKMPGTG
jgi:hypothetical protein